MAEEMVLLVDENDKILGIEEKMKAHQTVGGRLHRAISVFVFNKNGETLMQKRAMTKYHSVGQWSNACCSHPRENESAVDAGHRRLKEEMGFDCTLEEIFNFKYETPVGKGLTEREYDHILFGFYDGEPNINKEEASDWKWMSLDELKKDSTKNPEAYTPWLRMMLNEVISHYKEVKG